MWPFSRSLEPAVRPSRQHADERVSQDSAEPSRLWTTSLIVFLRVMTMLWIVRATLAWMDILGIGRSGPGFEQWTIAFQATHVVVAVVGLVTAVGLWLTSAWGIVLWLAMCILDLGLPFLYPAQFAVDRPAVWSSGVFVVLYFILVTMSARERSRSEV
jgi:hypothetical protein